METEHVLLVSCDTFNFPLIVVNAAGTFEAATAAEVYFSDLLDPDDPVDRERLRTIQTANAFKVQVVDLVRCEEPQLLTEQQTEWT